MSPDIAGIVLDEPAAIAIASGHLIAARCPVNVLISVTQEDIDRSTPGDGCDCPVYIAAKRALPDAVELIAGMTDLIFAPYTATARSFPLPPAAIEFIACYDLGHSVAPFEFGVELPAALAGAR